MSTKPEEVITLADGMQLIALDPKEKVELEKEIEVIMNKYSATFLPILVEKVSIARKSTDASIALYKKVPPAQKTNVEDTKQNVADTAAEAPVAASGETEKAAQV